MAKFRKTLLAPGTHYSPDGEVNASPKRLTRWVDTFKRMSARGIKVPIPWGHQPDAEPIEDEATYQDYISRYNAGYVTNMGVDEKGNLWFEGDCPGVECDESGNLVHWVRHADGTERKSAISEVSAGINAWRAGDDTYYPDSIIHVALTPLPVWSGQDGFSRLSSRRHGRPTLRLSAATRAVRCPSGARLSMGRFRRIRRAAGKGDERALSLLRRLGFVPDGKTESGKFRFKGTGEHKGQRRYNTTGKTPGTRGKPQAQAKGKAAPEAEKKPDSALPADLKDLSKRTELDEAGVTKAKRAYAQYKRHHGDKVLDRIREKASAMAAAGNDKALAALGRMAGWAEKDFGKGDPEAKPKEKKPVTMRRTAKAIEELHNNPHYWRDLSDTELRRHAKEAMKDATDSDIKRVYVAMFGALGKRVGTGSDRRQMESDITSEILARKDWELLGEGGDIDILNRLSTIRRLSGASRKHYLSLIRMGRWVEAKNYTDPQGKGRKKWQYQRDQGEAYKSPRVQKSMPGSGRGGGKAQPQGKARQVTEVTGKGELRSRPKRDQAGPKTGTKPKAKPQPKAKAKPEDFSGDSSAFVEKVRAKTEGVTLDKKDMAKVKRAYAQYKRAGEGMLGRLQKKASELAKKGNIKGLAGLVEVVKMGQADGHIPSSGSTPQPQAKPQAEEAAPQPRGKEEKPVSPWGAWDTDYDPDTEYWKAHISPEEYAKIEKSSKDSKAAIEKKRRNDLGLKPGTSSPGGAVEKFMEGVLDKKFTSPDEAWPQVEAVLKEAWGRELRDLYDVYVDPAKAYVGGSGAPSDKKELIAAIKKQAYKGYPKKFTAPRGGGNLDHPLIRKAERSSAKTR